MFFYVLWYYHCAVYCVIYMYIPVFVELFWGHRCHKHLLSYYVEETYSYWVRSLWYPYSLQVTLSVTNKNLYMYVYMYDVNVQCESQRTKPTHQGCILWDAWATCAALFWKYCGSQFLSVQLGPAKIIYLDLCQLPWLAIWGHKMKTPYVSSGILEIYYKSPPCLKIKCLPASRLSIAFADTVLPSLLQVCLPYTYSF